MSPIANPACEHCPPGIRRGERKYGEGLVEMAPGRDGQPWYLCIPCWLDGRPDKKASREPVVVSSEVADALEKSGWKVERMPAGSEPPKRRRKAG